MRYFVIDKNYSITNSPYMTNLHSKVNVEHINYNDYWKIRKRNIIKISGNPCTVFPDILSSPLFLVTQKVWKVISLYEPHTKFRQLVLLDSANTLMEVYHLPILQNINNFYWEIQGTSAKKIFIKYDDVKNMSVLKIVDLYDTYTILRMDIAESLLFRGYTGLRFKEVNLI